VMMMFHIRLLPGANPHRNPEATTVACRTTGLPGTELPALPDLAPRRAAGVDEPVA
jgi:hypothetical protein